MARFRSKAPAFQYLMAILCLAVAVSLVGLQVGDWPLENCADDCEEECQDFCGCTHCLTPPPAISVSIPVPEYEGGLTSSAGLALRSRFDQAWVSAIDHPPQLSL